MDRYEQNVTIWRKVIFFDKYNVEQSFFCCVLLIGLVENHLHGFQFNLGWHWRGHIVRNTNSIGVAREKERNRKLKESRPTWERSTKNLITRTDDKWISWADRSKLFCHLPIHHNTTLIYEWNTCRNKSICMWNNSSGAHANVRSIGWAHFTWTCCINRIEVEQRHSISICFPSSFFKISFFRFFSPLLIHFIVLGRISMVCIILASIIIKDKDVQRIRYFFTKIPFLHLSSNRNIFCVSIILKSYFSLLLFSLEPITITPDSCFLFPCEPKFIRYYKRTLFPVTLILFGQEKGHSMFWIINFKKFLWNEKFWFFCCTISLGIIDSIFMVFLYK